MSAALLRQWTEHVLVYRWNVLCLSTSISGFGFFCLPFFVVPDCSSASDSGAFTRTTAPAKCPPAVMNIAHVRPSSPPFCISFSSSRYEVDGVDPGKRTLYTPTCVDGGEWNHASGVPGPVDVTPVGDGERASLRVFCIRVATASESSSDSPSDDEAEPESESSKSVYISSSYDALRRAHALTVDQLCEMALRNGVPSVQFRLDVVAMPVGAVVHTLFIHICKCGSQADIACSSFRTGRRDGRERVFLMGTWCRVDDVTRNQRIQEFLG